MRELDAIGMRQRSDRHIAQRAVAVVAACVLLACAIIGSWHEAQCAHVRDQLTDVVRHAHSLIGKHVTSNSADVHGTSRDADDDDGVCAFDAVLHQAVATSNGVVALAQAMVIRVAASCAGRQVARTSSVLSRAPKTSPPIAG